MNVDKKEELLNELKVQTKAETLDQVVVDDILKEFGF